jgi:hypothetical protein
MHGLELHHSTAYALGGEHSEENLTLRCRAHNRLAAERDFGGDLIERACDSTEHEPWAKKEAARGDARSDSAATHPLTKTLASSLGRFDA